MSLQTVKKAYEKEVVLLEDLCLCLEQERQCLITGQIRDLWPLKDKKEQIYKEIKTQQEIIQRNLEGTEGSLGKGGPGELEPLRKKIRRLSLEIGTRNSENMRIVRDALDFIDGLIGVIASSESEAGAYGKDNQVSSHPRILYKEA